MLRVGITGPMGSGKSTACKYFEAQGIPVFNTDQAVKDLYKSHKLLKIQMIGIFGEEVYLEDGTINRKMLGDIIFNDHYKLMQVSAVVHPFLMAKIDEWKEEQDAPFYLVESAIIYELGAENQYDKVIYVHANEKVRFDRVLSRDEHLDRVQIADRFKQFLPDAEKIDKADFVIHNEDIDVMKKEVDNIISELSLEK